MANIHKYDPADDQRTVEAALLAAKDMTDGISKLIGLGFRPRSLQPIADVGALVAHLRSEIAILKMDLQKARVLLGVAGVDLRDWEES